MSNRISVSSVPEDTCDIDTCCKPKKHKVALGLTVSYVCDDCLRDLNAAIVSVLSAGQVPTQTKMEDLLYTIQKISKDSIAKMESVAFKHGHDAILRELEPWVGK